MAPKLIVSIVGDTSRLEKSFKRAGVEATGFGSSIGRLSVGFGQLAKGIIIVDGIQKALEGLGEGLHIGIEGFRDTTRVAAQTAAVIKSTGDASNLSAKQFHALAASLSNLSGIDDEVIQTGENALAAFTNIRDFAGKGNQIFTEATKAITDYAARTGKDLPQAAVVLGRALQDPADKLAGLSRAGIVFTKSQIDAVKAMVKTGGTLGAQRKIISDLEARYGGAAKAAGQTLPGQLNILRERFKDLAGELVGDVVPAFSNTIRGLTSFVEKITATQGIRAKLDVVWTGIQEAASNAQSALRSAIAKVDWKKVWASANGIADGLASRLQSVDWKAVGAAIGDGITKSISVAASATRSIAGKLEKIFKAIDWEKLGTAAGPGLASAVVTAFVTLTDPTFWIKHWDLSLAVASVAFGGPFGKLAGRLLGPFARLGADLIGRFGDALAEGASSAVERLGTKLVKGGEKELAGVGRLLQKLGGIFLDGLLKLPGIADRALARLLTPFVRAFTRLNGLTKLTIKVIGAQFVIDEIAKVVRTVGRVFGQLAKTIGGALDGAWKELERGAIKEALAIVEPFTHIPTRVGGKFREIKTSLEKQLDGMTTSSKTGAKNIENRLVDVNPKFSNLTASLKTQLNLMVSDAQTAAGKIGAAFGGIQPPAGLTGVATAANQAVAPVADQQALNKAAAFAAATPILPNPPALPAPKGLSATQRNTFFDNAISSDLTRAGFITNIKQQIGALQTIAGLISARIAATKDVTRRRTLEDQLLGVESQIKGDRAQVAQDFLATLQFGITKAQATAAFGDDIKAFQALEAGIKAQIKATGDTTDLEQQLFDARQGLAQAQQQALSAKEFKQLGFSATGDDIVPGVKRLKNELASVTDLLKGSAFDTGANEALLGRIRKTLTNALVPEDVRSKMQELLANLRQQLDGHLGQLTKFAHESSSKFAASIPGLTAAQRKAIEFKFAQVGPGGSIPTRGPAFAGVTSKAPSGVSAPSKRGDTNTTIVVHNPVFNGVTDVKGLKSELIKESNRRSLSRR